MRFLSVLCVLTLGLFSACGDDSNQPEWPAKEVTFSAYHFSCADATTKSPVTDTLRFAALGGSYAYDISFRRERIEGGIATGIYEYISPSSISFAGGDGFNPSLGSSNTDHSATLSFQVVENVDPEQALESSVVITAGTERVTLPVKQEAATLTLIGDPSIYHTALADPVVYLDHKGDTIPFEAVLATPYQINGKLVEDMLWTKEDALFTYTLSDDTWIQVLDVSQTEPGVFVLRIATVPTRDTYDAVLTLRFEWQGEVFTKEMHLQSTEVFHVDIV